MLLFHYIEVAPDTNKGQNTMSIFSRLFGKKDKTRDEATQSKNKLNATLFTLANNLYNSGEYEKAFTTMHTVAEQGGLTDAMFNLGMFYIRGIGTQKNVEEGIKWLKKAALQGDDQAAYNVAIFYHDGKIVARNFDEAKHWYEISAKLGNDKAKQELEFFKEGDNIVYYLWGVDTFANETFNCDYFHSLKEAEAALNEKMTEAGRPSPDTYEADGSDLRDRYFLTRESLK